MTTPKNLTDLQYEAPSQGASRLIDRDKFWELCVDHYWDSLKKDRDLILSHIVAVLSRMPSVSRTEERTDNAQRE